MGIASRLYGLHHHGNRRVPVATEPPKRVRVWQRPNGTIEFGNARDRLMPGEVDANGVVYEPKGPDPLELLAKLYKTHGPPL